MQVLNRDCFKGGGNQKKELEWFDKACGYSFDKASGWGNFNGGITNPQREHLRVGNRYYRFVSAFIPHSYKIGGVWWIEHETLLHIYHRYKAAGPNPNTPISTLSTPVASVFREWLALTFEWNMIEEIIVADLHARIDAYTGAGRVASGGHVMDNRPFGYAPHLSNMFTIKQLCIPELWVHQKKAFPGAQIYPFARLESLIQ